MLEIKYIPAPIHKLRLASDSTLKKILSELFVIFLKGTSPGAQIITHIADSKCPAGSEQTRKAADK